MKLSVASILLSSLVSSIEASPANDETNSKLHHKKTAGGDNRLLRRALSSEASNFGDLSMNNAYSEFDEDLAFTDDDSASSRYKHGGKSGKQSRDNDHASECVLEVHVDDVCIEFCDDYFKLCATNNIFLNPDMVIHGKSDKRERNLEDIAEVTSEEPDQPRSPRITFSDGLGECRKQCMQFPRGRNPATYPEFRNASDFSGFNSNLGGDTLWCRKRHLSLTISESGSDMTQAAFHCPHAGNPSAGICRDSTISIGGGGAFSPYEYLRDGQPSRHHVGFCDVAADETVAECTAALITDVNIGHALKFLPNTIEVIFLSGNNITSLDKDVFQNLLNPGIIQALYLNDCQLEKIAENTFEDMPELKIFNADSNKVTVLPDDLFKTNTELRQLSMFSNLVEELPENLFTNTQDLERLVMYDTKISKFAQDTFKGLSKLEMMSFVDNGLFDETSFPDDVFEDLVSLKFFDFFGNKFNKIEERWFDGGWGGNILRLAFWNNQITEIEEGAFDSLTSLEVAAFHLNPLADFVELLKLDNIVQLTLGPLLSPTPTESPTYLPTTATPSLNPTQFPTKYPSFYPIAN